MDWDTFSRLWKQLHFTEPERDLATFRSDLARAFHLEPGSFLAAIDDTERAAMGKRGQQRLSLEDHALAALATFRIEQLEIEFFWGSRMAWPSSAETFRQRLRRMRMASKRVYALIDLKREGKLDNEAFFTGLESVQVEVYRFMVFRAAALAHMRFHKTSPEQLRTFEMRSCAPNVWFGQFTEVWLGPSLDEDDPWTMFWEPQKTRIGSEIWYQGYASAFERAMAQAERSTRPQDAARLQALKTQQAHLALSVGRLRLAQPSLEALFEELEKPAILQ